MRQAFYYHQTSTFGVGIHCYNKHKISLLQNMAYIDLLKQKEWGQKCCTILNRDKYRCKDCGHIGYHNGDESFMETDTIEDVEKILDGWRFGGLSFSDFRSHIIYNYEYDYFSKVSLTAEEKFHYDKLNLLKFRLYDGQSKYFVNHCAKNSYGSVLSNIKCREIGLNAIQLFNIVSNKSVNIENSWTYYIEFERPLTNKIFVRISGVNYYWKGSDKFSYGAYLITINYDNKLFVFSIHSKELYFDGLNVHHTYYINGHKPWDYNEDALITLCEKCHKKRHEMQDIPIFNEIYDTVGYANICDKCGGSGYLPEFNHVKHGICFKCGGEGVLL